MPLLLLHPSSLLVVKCRPKRYAPTLLRPIVCVVFLGALLLLSRATTILAATQQQQQQQQDDNVAVVLGAYLPDYRFYIDMNAMVLHLTDLILFSIEASNYGIVRGVCCLDAHHYQTAREARRTINPNLKLWVSVGGASRSNGFVQITQDKVKRQTYIESLKKLCLEESLDGVDFDWEQPRTQQEYDNYMALLVEASSVFHQANLLVAVATRLHIPPTVANALDRIHLMAYNLGPPYHASYEKVQQFLKPWIISNDAATFPTQQKLILGIPAYAQHDGNGQMDKTVSEIGTDSPQALTEGTHQGYTFDSPRDVRRKVHLAHQHGLGGIFFWELGQDKQTLHTPGGVLLQAAHDAIQQQQQQHDTDQEL